MRFARAAPNKATTNSMLLPACRATTSPDRRPRPRSALQWSTTSCARAAYVIDRRSAPMTNAVDSGALAAWRSITLPSRHRDRSSDNVPIDLGAATGVREVVDLRGRVIDLRIPRRLALALGAAKAQA